MRGVEIDMMMMDKMRGVEMDIRMVMDKMRGVEMDMLMIRGDMMKILILGK